MFGVTLSWTGMSDPDVIRGALLFQEAYLFLFFASAVATATAGVWLLRRRRARALLTGERIEWGGEAPKRRHVVGSVLSGPAGRSPTRARDRSQPRSARDLWSLFTIAGVVVGIWAFLRRRAVRDRRLTLLQ